MGGRARAANSEAASACESSGKRTYNMLLISRKVTRTSLEDKIMKEIQDLPESKKAEVLDFVEYLKTKADGKDWSIFSLSSAMRDMEDENPPYSLNDLKESF